MEIRIISFDVDGTLVDPEYNDLIWHKALPEIVSKKENIDFDEALTIVQKEYDRVGEKDYRWYDIKYWINFFQLGIDYKIILQKYEPKIKIFSDVPLILEKLSKHYQLICTSNMPREFMDIKIKKIKTYFQETFSTLSDYRELKNKEVYSQINKKLKVAPQLMLHIGDHEELDYFSAREAGWNALLIDRCSSGLYEKYPDSVIHDLSDIFHKIEIIR
jgi:putative hydrolase of the HAD superfamily